MKLMHVSIWFGVESEPLEWAWFPEELDLIGVHVNSRELGSIYNDGALIMVIL